MQSSGLLSCRNCNSLRYCLYSVSEKAEQTFYLRLRQGRRLRRVVSCFLILFSAAAAAYESIFRLYSPQPVKYLGAVAAASIVGFLGNELVAKFRIKVGKEIGSAALIADGYHARADGFASLAVLISVYGLWLGYPLADPLMGLLITLLILQIAWEAGKPLISRMLDGVDPEIVDEIRRAVSNVEKVSEVTESSGFQITIWKSQHLCFLPLSLTRFHLQIHQA